jgi:hypothetical protein
MAAVIMLIRVLWIMVGDLEAEGVRVGCRVDVVGEADAVGRRVVRLGKAGKGDRRVVVEGATITTEMAMAEPQAG